MAEHEIVKQNFSSGLLSDKMAARSELEVYNNGCSRLDNFILQAQGPVEYRPGFNFVFHSRLHQEFNLISFNFTDEQSYQLEFTNQKLRFYRNNGVILETAVVINDITQADPGVVTTATTHGYATGDEVGINKVVGMTEVNGDFFLITVLSSTTFEITDVDGNNIDTSGFTAYASAGTSEKVFEIDTPYTEANDLFGLKVDQDAEVMYISHPLYLPRKLTRTDHTAWTLVTPTFTTGPFLTAGTGKAITAITQANPGVVTTGVDHTFETGDTIILNGVGGMTEVEGQAFIIIKLTNPTFSLQDLDGNNVDTTSFGAFTSGGIATNQNLVPRAVAFYESRLWFGGTKLKPAKIFASQSPNPTTGDARFEDFTIGAAADDGLAFEINIAGSNKIFWLAGTERLLMAGTFGSLVKITGSDDETAITPTNIKARPLDRIGCEDITPVNKESFITYIQRGGLTVKSVAFEALKDNFVPTDETLVADTIMGGEGLWSRLEATASLSGVKQLTYQIGRPDIMYAVKKNGDMLGQTRKPEEGINGWHFHDTGTTGEDEFTTASGLSRPSSFDQLWVGIKRTINSLVRYHVCFQADTPVHPKLDQFFTTVENEVADKKQFRLALLESQKEYVHLDSALTFDGRNAGLNASASVTPGATSGTGVTFTSNNAVWASTDVGRQIWKRAINGIGEGRAEITSFTSSTSVDCTILGGADFDTTVAMAPGDWYLTTDTLSNIDQLEGREIGVVTDGGVHPKRTVSSGSISLAFQSSVIHVGLTYEGFVSPMSLEFGGETGPATTKLRNILEFGFRFLNTLGADFGTDLYKPTTLSFANMPLAVGTPQDLFTGVKRANYLDRWENDKFAYVRQENPLPCVVQQIVFYGDLEEV